MSLPQPLPAPLVELIARRFRVLAEPMRIRLLDALRGREVGARELVELTGASQQNVSKHLGVLAQAGVVGRRKQGNLSLYRITDESMLAVCEHVCGSLERRFAELSEVVSGGAR